jgi:hypothetical protein
MPETTSWNEGLTSSGPYSAIITLSAAWRAQEAGVGKHRRCVGRQLAVQGTGAAGFGLVAESPARLAIIEQQPTWGAIYSISFLCTLHIEGPRMQALAD